MRKYSADGEFWKRQRADGSYGEHWQTNLGGERVSTKQTGLAAARRWRSAQEIERADPRRARAEATTLEDAIRAMYAELRRRNRADATIERCQEKLAHFPRLWGKDCKLIEIDAEKVDAYVDKRLEEGFSRLTIRDERAFLRQTLKLQKRYGKWPFAIEDVFPLFETGHKPKRDFVTAENLPKLLAHVEPRHAAHLLFFVVTAGRLSDSYRAERIDFDTTTWKALVRGSKTEGSYRTIPILEHLRPYAEQMLRDGEPNLLFLPWPNMHRDLAGACERAKIPRVTTNGLRRTFGKLARMHGYSLDTISKLFGHTTADLVRDVYADVDGDELDAVVEVERKRGRTNSGQPQQKQE